MDNTRQTVCKALEPLLRTEHVGHHPPIFLDGARDNSRLPLAVLKGCNPHITVCVVMCQRLKLRR